MAKDTTSGELKGIRVRWLVLAHHGGSHRDCEIADDAKITINGQVADVADLRKGDQVRLIGEPATEVIVSRG